MVGVRLKMIIIGKELYVVKQYFLSLQVYYQAKLVPIKFLK
jgi:hypothetical protein